MVIRCLILGNLINGNLAIRRLIDRDFIKGRGLVQVLFIVVIDVLLQKCLMVVELHPCGPPLIAVLYLDFPTIIF